MPKATTITNLCNYGRASWATRNLPGFQVSFPQAAGLKYLPAGVYYLLSDFLFSRLVRLGEGIVGATPQVAFVGSGSFVSGRKVGDFHFFSVGDVLSGINGRRLVNKEAVREAVREISQEQPFFTPRELTVAKLERNYRTPVTMVYWFLNEMVAEGELKNPEGEFYCAAQVDLAANAEALERARRRDEEAFADFERGVEIRLEQIAAAGTIKESWVTFLSGNDREPRFLRAGAYLFLLDKEGKLKQEEFTSVHEPSYRSAARPSGLMKAVLEGERRLYRVMMREDLAKTLEEFERVGLGDVDPSWIEESLFRYGIGTIDLLKLTDAAGKAVGVLLLRDPVYFGGSRQERVDAKLIELGEAIGRKIAEISAEALRIEQESARQVLPEFSAEEWTELNFRFYQLVQQRSRLLRRGIFEIGSLANPASSFNAEEKRLLADVLNWHGRSREDMLSHLLDVNEIEVVFYNGQAIAFGTGKELDYNIDGRQEKFLSMVGTMSRPEFYGYSMQTLVNGLFLIRSWRRYKREGGLFKAPRVMMRTRAMAPAAGFIKYFSQVVFDRVTGRQKARAERFSEHVGKLCDDNSVVWGAYEEPVRDQERDARIMADLARKNPPLYQRLTAAFQGLTEYDARIFQGKLTFWNVAKIWLYINVIFPWKYRSAKPQDLKQG